MSPDPLLFDPSESEDVEPPDVPSAVADLRPRTGGIVGAGVAVLTLLLAAVLLIATWAGGSVRSPPAVLAMAVMFLPYLYAAGSAVCFAAWCLVPDRFGPPAALFVLLFAGVVQWGPSWAARGETAPGQDVTVMSWNIQRLWGGPPDQDAFSCVAEAVEAADPAVITLLEVSASDTALLARRLGMSCSHSNYQASKSRQRGGLASCVRGTGWKLKSGRPMRFQDRVDWHYVMTEVQSTSSERTFNVLAAHLYPYKVSARQVNQSVRDVAFGRMGKLFSFGRTAQAHGAQGAALLDRVARFRDPTILAGDFNSTRDAAVHSALREHLTDAWEQGGQGFGGTVNFLEWAPLRIDYVYVTDEFAVQTSEVPQTRCSDHRPVVATLTLRD